MSKLPQWALLRSLLVLLCIITFAPLLPAQDRVADPSVTDHSSHGHAVAVPVADSAPRLAFFEGLLSPTIGLTADLVASWSDEEGREAGADGFILRGAELSIGTAGDGPLELFGLVFLDEEELELEEVFALSRTALPGDFVVKGGLYNLDFGRESILHDHETATLDKSSTAQELIGGTLRGTGLELRQESWRTGKIRWCASAGVLQAVESDVHAVLGPAAGHAHDEDEDDDEGPVRDVEDFALHLRLRAHADLTESSAFEFGASALSAPTATFGVDEDDERTLDAQYFGFDLGYLHGDPNDRGWRVEGEWILSRQEFGTLDDGGTPGNPADDLFTVDRVTARGFALLGEWRPDARRAFGVSGSFYEHAEDSAEDSSDVGAYATFQLDRSQRLRFEVRAYNDLPFDDEGTERALDFVAFSVQWTIKLGEHAGGAHGHDH